MQTLTRSGFFDAADGLKLYGDWYPSEGETARPGVIFVHGYADHCGRYGELGKRLASLGFSTFAFDYRGHGQAGGRRGHCDSFDEYLSDLDRACARARSALGDRPVVIVTHSHGGLIALRALCDSGRAPRGVVGLVMSSPYLGLSMKVSPLKTGASKLASRLLPRLALDNGIDPHKLTHDPAMLQNRASDRYCHNVATARWFTEATAAQAWVAANVGKLSVPSLWLIAGDDRLVDSNVAESVFAAAGGDKQLRRYEGFFHELFHEVERTRVFDDVANWLSHRFPSS